MTDLKNKSILVVAAHPDDEILGCGATIAWAVSLGANVNTLILGEGITARDKVRNLKKHHRDLVQLKRESRLAAKTLGVKKVIHQSLPDNRFDSLPLLDITKKVEKIIAQFQPEIVFTHFRNDLNIDHRITYEAVLTATRTLPGSVVKTIYAFETLSSTEFNYPLSFRPDTFVEVADFLELKISAMEKYQDEIMQFPHPRSRQGMELLAAYWGMRTGLKKAEAFETVRSILS